MREYNYTRQDDDTEYAVIIITLSPDGIELLNPNELTDGELALTFDTLAAIYEEEGE